MKKVDSLQVPAIKFEAEAVGLKSLNYTLKITILVSMWNPFAHMWHIKLWLSTAHNISCLVDFQLNADFPSQFYVFYRKIP